MKDILHAHLTRYPRMEPQDVMKLCYQSEFGPGHMITEKMAPYLYNEWQQAANTPAIPPEDIGGGLVRFHLTGQYDPAPAVPLLLQLFSRTAALHKGTREGLEKRLKSAEDCLAETKDQEFLTRFREYVRQCRSAGFPAVHHSESFRSAYAPHYRLLRRDFAGYFPLLLKISSMEGGIVAIDGDCGSGKSTLAQLIAALFDCNVVHMDDYYLPINQRQENWRQIPGGNMDFARLRQQVLVPLSSGASAQVLPYRCTTGGYGTGEVLSPKPLTILEGGYSLHPQLREFVTQGIFLRCGTDAQLARLQKREEGRIAPFTDLWIPMERRYQAACPPPANTMFLDTTSLFL